MVFNIIINLKNVNTDCNFKDYFRNIGNHTIFYKLKIFLALNNLFKIFQILKIIYIFD